MQTYFDEPFYVGFDINGFEPGPYPHTKHSTPGNHTVSYWSEHDTDKVAEKLLSIGATLIKPRTNVGGPIHVAIVEDPFGNDIGLTEGA